MNITDDPMPGVAQPGTEIIVALCLKDDLITTSIWGSKSKHLRAWCRQNAADYDEVILIKGKIDYRVWSRDAENKAVA